MGEQDKDMIMFDAQVYSLRTLVDGGIRVTLDLSEMAIEEATQLMHVLARQQMLRVAALPFKPSLLNSRPRSPGMWLEK